MIWCILAVIQDLPSDEKRKYLCEEIIKFVWPVGDWIHRSEIFKNKKEKKLKPAHNSLCKNIYGVNY